jgi:7-cyano-7-deazaguanine synthase in queuosine biosynthesis
MRSNRLSFKTQFSVNRNIVTSYIAYRHFPRLKVEGVGPLGIDDISADLLDLATAVFLIERSLPGKQHVNRAVEINAELGMRVPRVWSRRAIEALDQLLLFMGGIRWRFRFWQLNKAETPLIISKESRRSKKVALFSGGLDSLCGAATMRQDQDISLVSYYTRQKNLQRDLASGLGMRIPIQWSLHSGRLTGRGTNYFYRSFLFLCMAAVTARSYGANNILQFENGILASGIAPSLSGRSTKHAHYRVHRLCEIIFSEVLDGGWQITNPFEKKTKREAFLEMRRALGTVEANELAERAESCWHLYAGYKHKRLGTKENGMPCGFCVPCIVRQTAHPQKVWRDLRRDDARNDPIHGHFFREFYAMLSGIQKVRHGSLGDFYAAIGTSLQDAIRPRGGYDLSELRDLFTRFAGEFMTTFNVKK